MKTGYQSVRVDTAHGVQTITLNLPERKNALGPAMVNELLHALDDAREDDAVRVVVLTGAGNAFCAGGDLKQMMGGATKSELPPKGDYVDLLMRFRGLGKPTVARLNGYAYGGGLGLVACCDFAVAGQSVKMGTPEIKRGLFPMMIMAVLQRVVPRRELLNMMLLGERIMAEEAKRIGLLSHVVPDDELDAKVEEISNTLAASSPTALRMGLLAFHHQSDRELTESLPYLRDQLFALLGTADAREGLMAFFEKREPVWGK